MFYLLLLAVTSLCIFADWLWRWDTQIYDAHYRFWSRPAPEDIVIIGIDEASLEALGRWPWSRRTHAELVERLTAAGAKAVALDLIFAEPDPGDPQGDAMLVRAIRENGRTVLPVLAEQLAPGGQLIETLPMPGLAEAAAKLAHVHIELDFDAVARSIFLIGGLGEPHWVTLGVAMLQIAEGERWAADGLPGRRAATPVTIAPNAWVQDHYYPIAFAGPPGHFRQISYVRALQGAYPAELFKDKLVLVGTTASGLGDALPTPVSSYAQPMSGVEINANVIDSLRSGIAITPVSNIWRLVINALVLLLPALFYPRLSPRAGLLLALFSLVATIISASLLLVIAHLWFPPASLLVALILSYPLWSWLRLERTMRYLNQEIARLHADELALPTARTAEPDTVLNFLAQLLPLRGWRGANAAETVAAKAGGADVVSHKIGVGDRQWTLMVDSATSKELPLQEIERFLAESSPAVNQLEESAADSSGELVQTRIKQVQSAAARLRAVRGVIDQSLAQMSDGVLIADSVGRILLANQRACEYLGGVSEALLKQQTIVDLLRVLRDLSQDEWLGAIRQVVIHRQAIQLNGRIAADLESDYDGSRDLLIQMAPIMTPGKQLESIVVSLSDITALKDSERKRNEILAFVSHDLRAPIVSVLSLLELAKNRREPQKLDELLARAENYTETTLALAEQFLELARAESIERFPLEEVDLASPMLQAIDQVWAQAAAKHIEITSTIETDEAWVRGDGSLLERSIVNLLTNAIKYSPEATSVHVSLSQEADGYQVCVSDQGPGIPVEALSTIFDRYARGAGSRDERGIGLGLAIVKTVAERHGGRVEVASQVGDGAEFCIWLPAAIRTADEPG